MNFIDDISAQGQDLINVIDDLTDAFTIYARAYFEFVAFGACYTYRDVVGNQLIKRVVSVRDAFPVPNDNMFAEDYDMFAERRMLTKQQIIDEFYEYLSEKEREALDTYYQYSATTSSDKALLNWDKYMYYFGDICSKFNKDDLQHIKNTNIMARDANNGLFEVWHTVWRGEIKEGILTYSNGAFVTTRIVDELISLTLLVVILVLNGCGVHKFMRALELVLVLQVYILIRLVLLLTIGMVNFLIMYCRTFAWFWKI